VSPNGRRITSLELSIVVGSSSSSISLIPEGEGMPIDEDGSFDLSVPVTQLIFRGQFSQDGTKATGLWEMVDHPFVGTVSEEWGVER
jgi:DNA gyrase/topoisomerase IV subunit B